MIICFALQQYIDAITTSIKIFYTSHPLNMNAKAVEITLSPNQIIQKKRKKRWAAYEVNHTNGILLKGPND